MCGIMLGVHSLSYFGLGYVGWGAEARRPDMAYCVVDAGIDLAKYGRRGGGGRVLAEIQRVIPCETLEVRLTNTERTKRYLSQGSNEPPPAAVNKIERLLDWSAIIRRTAAATKWAAKRGLQGVVSMLSMPPGPGPIPRYMYAHMSLWDQPNHPWYRPMLHRYLRWQLGRRLDGCTVMCNSQWLCDTFIRHGAIAKVVYPPCRINVEPSDLERTGVVAVGRLVPKKGHDLVARVTKQVGSTCKIYGSGLPTSYGEAVVHANASDSDIVQACQNAKAVMSGCHREDFGIAVVEAMAIGCIPVVPDCYGFKETVPYNELRYAPHDETEANTILNDVLAGVYDDLVPKLVQHIQQYSVHQFHSRIRQILDYHE